MFLRQLSLCVSASVNYKESLEVSGCT